MKISQFDSLFTKVFGAWYLGMAISVDISLFIAIYGENYFVTIISGCTAFLLSIHTIMCLLFDQSNYESTLVISIV